MKTCKHCGEPYAKRPKEAYWQFDERKFCSSACANRGNPPRVAALAARRRADAMYEDPLLREEILRAIAALREGS